MGETRLSRNDAMALSSFALNSMHRQRIQCNLFQLLYLIVALYSCDGNYNHRFVQQIDKISISRFYLKMMHHDYLKLTLGALIIES